VTKYAVERVRFGQAIGMFQINQDLIVQMVTDEGSANVCMFLIAQDQLGFAKRTSRVRVGVKPWK
jgi:hypothetical protein